MRRADLPQALRLVSGSRSYKDAPAIGRALARARLNLSSFRDDVIARQQDDKIYTSDLSRAFVAARRRIAGEFAIKDEKGNPVADARGNISLENPLAFEDSLRRYSEEHPDEKAAADQEEEAYRAWLNDEVPYDRTSVKEDDLPVDATADELWAMYLLLDVQA